MKLLSKFFFITFVFFAFLTGISASNRAKNTYWEANFKNPPSSVKPWCYWYWYSDNISKDGIIKDLKAMSEVGIGTALIGNISQGGEAGNVKALTDEWWDCVKFAIKEADKYGVEIGFFNCPGWSQSGGPWITNDKTMRHLVSSEINITGNQYFSDTIVKPIGFFQDVRIMAFPTPKHDKDNLTINSAKITANFVTPDLKNLLDADMKSVCTIPEEALLPKSTFEITIDAEKLFHARSLTLYPSENQFITDCELFAENDKHEFISIRKFNFQRPGSGRMQIGPMFDGPKMISFPTVSSSRFKLQFSNFRFHAAFGRAGSKPGFKEIELSGAYRLDNITEKKLSKVFPMPQPMWHDYMWEKSNNPESTDLLINPDSIIDLTSNLKNNTLNWKVPNGKWTVVRICMVPTGAKNAPVLDAARGPEVDKLTKQLAYFHFDSYIGKLIREIKPNDRKALKYCVIDSYEQGSQNWTDSLEIPFKEAYGYDPMPYLAVCTGRAVGSVEKSERFLWDLRRLIADRVSLEYAAGMRERANQNGLKLWMENYGHWGFPGEFLQYGGQSDIVSGEFWATGDLGSIELKDASSAAHIYGQTKTCAESFTSGFPNFFFHPWTMKKRGDWSFTEGINQTLLHVYLHQPDDNKLPGVNAWFGSDFNRLNTWFFKMSSWIEYLKRSNFMLQQGKYVADVMYFIGEDAPKMTGIREPELPQGYSYDYINADVIMNRLSVKNGIFVLPDGMTFKLLVLPQLKTIRPELLQKLETLVKQGGSIFSQKPLQSPSLKNYPECDHYVQKTASNMWQNCDGKSVQHVKYGDGNIYSTNNLSVALTDLNTPPDIDSPSLKGLLWIHRKSVDGDIYFITNQTDSTINVSPTFRVNNLKPQLWDAVTGKITQTARYKVLNNGVRTNLTLRGLESVFVMFKTAENDLPTVQSVSKNENPINNISYYIKNNLGLDIYQNGKYDIQLLTGKTKSIQVTDVPAAFTVSGAWDVKFQAKRDVTENQTFDSLKSWTNSKDEALKYYSGSAVYSKKIELPSSFFGSNKSIIMDLGKVGVIAEVKVNGINFGDFWSIPMQIDITKALKQGENNLEITVTNVWRNRLIGDAKYKDSFPSANGTSKQFKTYLSTDLALKGNEDLTPSGLIGPVQISVVKSQIIQ